MRDIMQELKQKAALMYFSLKVLSAPYPFSHEYVKSSYALFFWPNLYSSPKFQSQKELKYASYA